MKARAVLALARSCHPEPTAAVTSLVTLLALRWGRGAGTAWVTVPVLCGQLSVGWANDYLDRERDAGRADKPVAAGLVPPWLVAGAAAVALALAVLTSLISGLAATGVHLVALALAHGYNLRLKGSVLSVLAYAGAFAMAPAFVTLGLPAHRWPPAWVMVAAALLGAGAHFTQTLGDHERDHKTGVRGLPQRIGRRRSILAAALLLGAAAVTATFGAGQPGAPALLFLAASVALVGATVDAALRSRYLLAFRLSVGAAGAAVLSLLVDTGSGFG